MQTKTVTSCPRYLIIARMLQDDPSILAYLFANSAEKLAASPATLRRESGALSSGQKVLVNAALDLWSGEGQCSLSDIAFRLDPTRRRRVLVAIAELANV